MVEVLPDADTGVMVLQVKRTLHGKTWRFELEIAQKDWEDLFEVTEGQGPQAVPDAYACAPKFWDRLAEENADALERSALPGAKNRHLRKVWPDHASLQAAYRKHRP